MSKLRVGQKQRKLSIKEFDIVKNWMYYLLILPAIALYFIFAYMPMPGIILAFKDFNFSDGIFGSKWIGFENFKAFFTSSFFWRTTRNTFVINILNLIFSTSSAVIFAILINELFSHRAKKLYQSILFLPTFFSVLLIGRFVGLIFSDDKGILNNLLVSLGLKAIPWYQSPKYWIPIIIFVYIWKGVGYGLIVYLASILNIDEELYEAATIDGAGRIKQIFTITLPLLKPTIITLVLLSIGRMFYGDFQMIYAIVGNTNPDLLESLDIIETYLYRSVTSGNINYGMATAVGLYQTVLGFIFIFGSNYCIKKINKDYALF